MLELDDFILIKGLLLGFSEHEIQVAYNFLIKYCDRYNLKVEDIIYGGMAEKEFSDHLRHELNHEE